MTSLIPAQAGTNIPDDGIEKELAALGARLRIITSIEPGYNVVPVFGGGAVLLESGEVAVYKEECPSAMPLADMLDELDRFADDADVVGYVDRFRAHLAAIGADLSAVIERHGSEGLMIGCRCDAQVRYRSRWIHFLFEHFNRDDERRLYLIR